MEGRVEDNERKVPHEFVPERAPDLPRKPRKTLQYGERERFARDLVPWYAVLT